MLKDRRFSGFSLFPVTLTFHRCQQNLGGGYSGTVLLKYEIMRVIEVKLLTLETDNIFPMLRDRDFPDFRNFHDPRTLPFSTVSAFPQFSSDQKKRNLCVASRSVVYANQISD